MLVKNCTAEDLAQVCDNIGVTLAYAPRDVKGGIRVRFVPKRSLTYQTTYGHFRWQRRSASWMNSERKIYALCWHGYREVFRELFVLAPETKIYTNLTRSCGIKFYNRHNFEQAFPKTGYINIGSAYMPVQAREACFCADSGDYIGD